MLTNSSQLGCPEGSLVAWRLAESRASAIYAAIVRELVVSGAGRNKARIRPESPVFGLMTVIGGDWRRADDQTRNLLHAAYQRLGLEYAATQLKRLETQ